MHFRIYVRTNFFLVFGSLITSHLTSTFETLCTSSILKFVLIVRNWCVWLIAVPNTWESIYGTLVYVNRMSITSRRIKLQLLSQNEFGEARVNTIYRWRYIIGESHMLRVIQIERRPDRSTHALSVHTGRAYGPVYVHTVSNRYRGYRETGGEINAHRPAASITTTSTPHTRARSRHTCMSHIFRRVNVATADLRR